MRSFTSLTKIGAKMRKRISLAAAIAALVVLTTSCVALHLIEIDVIETQVDSSGDLVGNRITFRATLDNADAYIWDFGDGATGAGQFVVHTYNTDGTFTVTLDVLINGQSFNSSTVVQIELREVGQGSLLVDTNDDGFGSGTVTSNPAGISCTIVDGSVASGTCGANFTLGTMVTLTATPTADSTFLSWTGCDNPSGSVCVETINGLELVDVDFTELFTLTVELRGGATRIFSDVGGIDCPGTCSATFSGDTNVTLTMEICGSCTTPVWEGNPSAPGGAQPCVTNNAGHDEIGTNPIIITMDRDRYCIANPIL